MGDSYDEFSKWCNDWDKARADWGEDNQKSTAPKSNMQTDFFGLQTGNVPTAEDEIGYDASWNKILDRTSDMHGDPQVLSETTQQQKNWEGLFKTEAKDQLLQKQNQERGFNLSKHLGDKDVENFEKNPINPFSLGPDGLGDDGVTGVTPNFTDGEELRELAELKDSLHKLQDQLQRADVLQASKGSVMSLKKEMAEVLKKIQELSNSLTPKPLDDVF